MMHWYITGGRFPRTTSEDRKAMLVWFFPGDAKGWNCDEEVLYVWDIKQGGPTGGFANKRVPTPKSWIVA